MSRLQDRRYWIGGGVLVAVLIAAIGWLGVISPKLSSASSLRDDAAAVDVQNAVLQGKASALKRENDKIGALTASLNKAVVALPFDSGLPEFTRQVSGQAAQNGVALTSITVASVTTAGTGTGNGSAAGAAPATGTGNTATSSAGGMFAIPITLIATGSAAHELAFLKAIQVDGPRRALVMSTQFAPITGSTSIQSTSIDTSATMTVQLSIFTAPLTAQQKAQLIRLLNGDVSSK